MGARRRQRLIGGLVATSLPLVQSLVGLPADSAESPGGGRPGSVPRSSLITAPSPAGPLALQLRRLPDAVEVVVLGTGAAPVLQQSGNGSLWQGQLSTAQPTGLLSGPQRLSLPEAGIQAVSLNGAGNAYQLQVSALPGQSLGRPVVSADGRNLVISFPTAGQAPQQTTARLDLRTPGTVPQPTYAPPLQPRAVAPPLGDMAVGSMVLRNRSFINVSGPAVSMTMRNAPAKDVLMALAQMGGYGFVYVDDVPAAGQAAAPQDKKVSIAFRGESYSRALNSVLLSAGLQGKTEGNMIFAGPSVLGKSFGSQLSKVYRLNQASAASAADYLASLGATISKVSVITNSVTQGQPVASQVAGGAQSAQTQTQNITTTETYGASTGPLKGLSGTTDSRLQTITLVGDSQLVAVAESYLRQLDLRQRQVALSVKILDITLDNDTTIDNSFAFRYGNNFIVNDAGQMLGAWGRNLPPGQTAFTTAGSLLIPPAPNPGLAYPRDNFSNFLKATIESSNTKVLASPTLILSENQEEIVGGAAVNAGLAQDTGTQFQATIGRPRANESFVTVGEQVVTNYTQPEVSEASGTATGCEATFGIAGLTLGARVSKIDDNGFVTFTISPQIAATTRTQRIEGCGDIDILSVRRLDTGSARVRDGQTLILTGVISDTDSQIVKKWPILGDIPFIGQFFRGSAGSRSRRELVILVTPRIINDVEGGTYGYGYQPSVNSSRQFLSGSEASGAAF